MQEKSVRREISEKYIKEYFLERSGISKTKQPGFWEAVKRLAEDSSADVSGLLDEATVNCLEDNQFFKTRYPHIRSIWGLADYFAQQIVDAESNERAALDLFILKKNMEELSYLLKC